MLVSLFEKRGCDGEEVVARRLRGEDERAMLEWAKHIRVDHLRLGATVLPTVSSESAAPLLCHDSIAR